MGRMEHPLKTKVESFLHRGKEGDNWDFKLEWHQDIRDLLKDVICFANTVHSRDCYIIFGVDDDREIRGMNRMRRKQADIIDAISKLQFAGDIAPKISVDTLTINTKEVDVLTIQNSDMTPIYLKQTYGDMKVGCIYLRIEDRNTPDNGNADLLDIEMLWKKRLGLTRPPLDQVFMRLKNRLEWTDQDGRSYYNIYRPEYTLVILNDESRGDEDEFYSYAMMNNRTSFSEIQIKCHGTY